MKPLWNYKDIFDLEFFFHKDSTMRNESLVQRDRDVYLHHIEPTLATPATAQDPGLLLHRWLEHRRQTEFGARGSLSPGTLFIESRRTLRLVILVFGLFSGSIVGLGFFNYAGTTPVNIFSFLVFFIFTQVLALIALLMSAALRSLLRRRTIPPPLAVRLIADLITRTILWGHRNLLGRMWADSRDSLAASIGLLKSTQKIYGSLFFWPLFALLQVFAIAMNAGLLAATLFRILTSDIAFGWQSTVQFSAQALHRLVALIALPWSWCFPEGVGYPTLTAIQGSRIILKDGISTLATGDLVSWWPFLVLCLLVYGLLPRIILHVVALIMQRRCLNRLNLRHPPCLNLLQRMQTPMVSTQAAPEPRPPATELVSETVAAGDKVTPPMRRRTMLALIPDDIYPAFTEDEIPDLLDNRGYSHSGTVRFMENYEKDREVLDVLRRHDWTGDCGILIFMESWMPPLIAFLSYLGEIRQSVGADIPIVIELLGRSTPAVSALEISEGDWLIWHRKITALGDPFTNLAPRQVQPAVEAAPAPPPTFILGTGTDDT
ncbi:DUF2868 domain-containing protein [Desulfoprunum benzoelyticum]|uniref:DUF2868 domain-containing protein n=1 Tax=Desulfoprunum benzoelyticum TaxID=1506996 RepID=A0A840V5Q8_9BACT|nr:DUF2868 domain-containing protein [Desulfoprunum benzoelyticum]MBB5349089.1 hypothetical protein [Desulfoprunum benzoelyticum]MBM9530672.1 DUF2868 domain-containing protein [Desulfoprunum benzoelyticum]